VGKWGRLTEQYSPLGHTLGTSPPTDRNTPSILCIKCMKGLGDTQRQHAETLHIECVLNIYVY
jgi:hypothetical protein